MSAPEPHEASGRVRAVDGAGPAGPEDPPPLLGSWRNVYLLLVGELALLAAAFALLTWWAA